MSNSFGEEVMREAEEHEEPAEVICLYDGKFSIVLRRVF
jgi:hypothetical protein